MENISMLCFVPPIGLLICVKSEADGMDQINMFVYVWDNINVEDEVASFFFCHAQ